MPLGSPFWTVSHGKENTRLIEDVGAPISMTYVSNVDDDELTLVWGKCERDVSSRQEFAPGEELVVTFGRAGKPGSPVSAIIDNPQRNYDTNSMTVTCRDIGSVQKGLKFNLKHPESNTLGATVEAIATKWGLEFEIEPEAYGIQGYEREQVSMSDWEYLRTLAKARGWDYWIDNEVVHFQRESNGASEVRLVYGSGRTVLKCKVSTKAQDAKAGNAGTEGKGFDPETRKPVNEKAGEDDNASPRLSQGTVKVGLNPGRILSTSNANAGIVNVASSDPEEVKANAVGAREEMLKDSQTAKLTVIGYPFYRAKMLITLDGVDDFHAGLWRIKKATHTISISGYVCSLDLDRKTTGKNPAPQIGEVEDTKTDDPKLEEAQIEHEFDFNSGRLNR